VTSPEGLGMRGEEDPVGMRGDGDEDLNDPPTESLINFGNTFIMAWGRGETNSGLNWHRIDPGGK